MTVILPIHVAAGALAMITGAVALLARKGGIVHRRGGAVFAGAMLVMGISAALLGNVGGGLLAAYFVVTAVTTLRHRTRATAGVDAVAAVVVVVLAAGTIEKGIRAYGSPGGFLDGVPFPMHFFMATVMMVAVAGDVRLIRSGPPRGTPRLARHLWRMCFALFIAAGSFFSIRERVAKILPDPLNTLPLRLAAIGLPLVAMGWWLRRLRDRRRPPPARVESVPA